MNKINDPTVPIKEMAASYAKVQSGFVCNQNSFRTAHGAFLFIGPGGGGVGYKAMFRLKASLGEAKKMAKESPERFFVSSNGWVTTRFSKAEPLTPEIWHKWLDESYGLVDSD